jgi:heptosyltransferase-2
MALPALREARADTIVVRRWLEPLIALADLPAAVLSVDRGVAAMATAASRLRKGRYARGILLTPSFSSALLFSLARVRHVRGSATDRRSVFLADAVPRAVIDADHRTAAYWLLVTGSPPAARPVPLLEVPDALRRRWTAVVGPSVGPVAGIVPGSNAPSRRWPAERFAEVASALAANGVRVVVFGAPPERELTRAVAGDVAFDAGGRTDLSLLAAGLASCDILVTNDSGPMHLAAAVGTPTLAVWGAGNPRSTGPSGDGHQLLVRQDLPCVPCVKNRCPRSGAGYVLPDAERECLNLITATEVLTVAHRMLAVS